MVFSLLNHLINYRHVFIRNYFRWWLISTQNSNSFDNANICLSSSNTEIGRNNISKIHNDNYVLQDINVMLSVLSKSIVLTAIGISLNYTVFVYILCLIKLKKSVVKTCFARLLYANRERDFLYLFWHSLPN